jgi:glycosyltransferase involved in cell wall biosynthesis
VISTYIAGIPELVEAGRTGWLVPAGEIESLAAAMDSALAMPHARLDEMGRAGMARARARHHIDTEAAKLAALFAEGQKA